MGVIVKETFSQSQSILLLVKGADDIVMSMSQSNDWCEEECGNLAREGLRTLAFAKR
jgi:phospholipid-translocating ATPase